MPNNAMTPHISGTTIDGQVSCNLHSMLFFKAWLCSMVKCTETETINLLLQLRYAAGVKDMLERYFKGQDFPEPNYIVKEGKLASQYQ
jgi:formate dehydrogenase